MNNKFNYKAKPSYTANNNIKLKVQSSKEDNGEQTSSQNNAINEDSGEDTSSQNNNIDESKTEKLQGIEKIDISVAAAINVIPKGTEEINAHLYGNIEIASSKNKPELQCYASGNTLFIIEKMNEGNYNKMDSSNQNLKLDVYVPAY